MQLEDLLIRLPATVRDAIETIDSNARGICFVTDGEQRLVGVVTDGDVRRGLLSGQRLDSPVAEVMNPTPRALPVDVDVEEARQHLSRGVTHIPLLDRDGRVVDFLSRYRLHRIPVLEPQLGAEELANVVECIETTWISSQGRFVTEFETQVARRVGAPRALATSSGTTALHLALEALDIGPGDEVVVPTFTFMASINAIVHAGATPVLTDVDPDTWTMTVDHVRDAVTDRTKAIMPVHLYGHPCDMDPILEFAEEFGLLVVEDAAEALGSRYRGRPVGSMGDAGALSFFGNKVITTGEGGMALFRSEEDAQRAAILRDHGMTPGRRYWHERIGFNYRMTNLQAAVGVAQMDKLERFLDRRRQIAERYRAAIAHLDYLVPQQTATWAESCNWLFTVLLSEDSGLDRDNVASRLAAAGVDTRPAFYPAHVMPPYQQYVREADFPVAEQIAARSLSLPSSVTLTDQDVDDVLDRLTSVAEASLMLKLS